MVCVHRPLRTLKRKLAATKTHLAPPYFFKPQGFRNFRMEKEKRLNPPIGVFGPVLGVCSIFLIFASHFKIIP